MDRHTHDQGEITVHGSFLGEGLTVYNDHSPDGQFIPSLGGYSAAFTPQMSAFLDAVLTGKPVANNALKALGEVMVAKATYKSVQSKKWEEVSFQNLTDY